MNVGGQARRILNNFLDKWDHANVDNVDYEDAIIHEAKKDVWRAFYNRKVVSDLRKIHVAIEGKAPIKLDALEDHVEEPVELEEFSRHHARHLLVFTLVNKDELIAMTQEGEFKAKMRATGQVPDPRQTEPSDSPTPLEAPPRPHRPMAKRLQ